MAQKKGQTGNPKGRPKGKPNKTTADLREWVVALMSKNLTKIEKDLKGLEPKDRLVILERLMQYALPKQQAVSIEAQIQAEYAAIESLIKKMPDEAVNKITEHLIWLNKLNKGEHE